MASVVAAFPAAVACALLVAPAVYLVGSASASWHARVFEVGGEPRGWAKPATPNGETYNHWAARNRFHVGDFLHFKYDKNDSVLVVSRDDYKFCAVARPSQRFDGGDTRLRLDHSGFSYFISGAPGHCDAGQRMTLRVLPQQQQDGGSEAAPAGAPAAMAPGSAAGGSSGSDEGGKFGPPYGSGSGSGGGAGGSVTGPGLTSSSTPPPHPHGGVVGTDANNTSGAASSSFGGCCHHVVGAVVMGALLMVLSA